MALSRGQQALDHVAGMHHVDDEALLLGLQQGVAAVVFCSKSSQLLTQLGSQLLQGARQDCRLNSVTQMATQARVGMGVSIRVDASITADTM